MNFPAVFIVSLDLNFRGRNISCCCSLLIFCSVLWFKYGLNYFISRVINLNECLVVYFKILLLLVKFIMFNGGNKEDSSSCEEVQNPTDVESFSCDSSSVDNNGTQQQELSIKIPIVGYEVMEQRAKFTVSCCNWLGETGLRWMFCRFSNCVLKLGKPMNVISYLDGTRTLFGFTRR